ncbi:MAG TPA: MarR family transcriptional regulator [Flavobacteriia bacterium]|jgi:DNA-binding MarR family transcriptional regulator|nr:MarR family transcriptional regulator [Flavobacteriia bacterium]
MNTKSKTKDFENSIAPWLGKTVKIVEYHLQETFDQHHIDLTKEQMIVLKKLHNKDGLNQNELAFLTLRNKSSLTRLLRKMEKKKYISRKQSKVDKRINNVYLTDLGREIFKKTRPVIQKIIDVMEQHITEKEKQQIIHTLKKIQFNFNSKEPSL